MSDYMSEMIAAAPRIFAAAAIGCLFTIIVSVSAMAETVQRVTPVSREGMEFSFAPIVKRVTPAVVNVYAQHIEKQQASPFSNDPFFRQFFGGDAGAPRDRVERSLGSGVIVDADGLVVTNYHVIANATDVKVALADKREFPASIILKDQRADLAVLRLKGVTGGLATLDLAASDSLEVGDLVLAVGNPFGVGQTVTSGIVSALARTQVGVSDFQSFIQTDAAINPGNSGGPLVDMEGHLVGLNTAIFSQSGGNIGIGFAIPADMVRVVVNSAKSGADHTLRPWLGATLQSVTDELAQSVGLDRAYGAIVTGVVPGGPSDTGGLKVGDVVTGMDGKEISDPDDFGYRFATKPIGGTASLNVLRNGSQRVVPIALAAAPETTARDEEKLAGPSPLSGATVANLSPALAESLGMDVNATGVVVTDVDPDQNAGSLGFQKKDIVVAVNGELVPNTKALDRLARGEHSLWRVTINRDGQQITSMFGGG